jgi:hypothetical protein
MRGGLNMYAFVGNHGVNNWDLLGKDPANDEVHNKKAGPEEVKNAGEALKKLCADEKCLDRCACSKEECEKEAEKIAKTYIDTFNAIVKNEANHGARHGGWLCYEWAEKIHKPLSEMERKCWSVSWVGTGKIEVDEFRVEHNFVWVSLGSSVRKATKIEAPARDVPVKDCGLALDPWKNVRPDVFPPEGGQNWNYIQNGQKGTIWHNGKQFETNINDFVLPE